MRSAAGGLLDRPWIAIGVAATLAFAVWAVGTRTSEHHVRVAFDAAVSVAPGLDVQVAGVDAGKVADVEYEGGRAIVRLGIDDDVWPLRHGTTATLRFGTTVGNGTRRVDLVPGPADAPPIPEDGVISARHSTTPTEFDEVFQMLDAPARADLRDLQENADRVLDGRARELGEVVRGAGPALDAATGVLRDLAADDDALRDAVRHSDRALRRLGSREGEIRALVTVAGRTFATLGRHADEVGRSIAQTPSTLRRATTTFSRLDRSVDALDALVDDLAPGARALRPFAEEARPALRTLRAVVPQARATVDTATRAAPEITRFLAAATPFLREATPVLADLRPVVGCLRPYAPEISGWLSNWASFTKNFDGTSHYARVRVVESQTSLTDTPDIATKDFLDTIGTGQQYAGLRPPGLGADAPWHLESCGVGPDVLDPGADWEDRR